MKRGVIIGVAILVILAIIVILAVYLWPKSEAPEDCIEKGVNGAFVLPCCDSLDKIEVQRAASIEDKCYILPSSFSESSPQTFVCADCGNGDCEAEESVCTCPQDCTGKGKSDYKTIQEFCDSGLKVQQYYSCTPSVNPDLCKLCESE
jgi:hypothetical protein